MCLSISHDSKQHGFVDFESNNVLLTRTEGERISCKSRVADTVKGPISRVSTDALSTEPTRKEVTWVCQQISKMTMYVIHLLEICICTVMCTCFSLWPGHTLCQLLQY